MSGIETATPAAEQRTFLFLLLLCETVLCCCCGSRHTCCADCLKQELVLRIMLCASCILGLLKGEAMPIRAEFKGQSCVQATQLCGVAIKRLQPVVALPAHIVTTQRYVLMMTSTLALGPGVFAKLKHCGSTT
jgi:hypothetical protein